ncbi:sensor domain-containing diguanylate cyclase [Idiomarina abyssalis]|uniref:sensor domain-containing diguanylate cyclase n=1 Tax=Idiomarina abyssalis TaxID=86102 RepID=UPI001C976CCE|nr:GGDEF domain-containing protein [Idiomarina abyssalis]QZN91971.1 GGDEF domain-containing protein [Idiomarina abyssalis]
MNQRHMPVLLRKLMIPSAVTEVSDLENILDNLDAVVYVSDTDTHELLFMNKYALKNIGGVSEFDEVRGKRCFEVLQKGQSNPCDFCTNPLLPKNGDTYLWEFKNTRNNCWYQCRDRLIQWHDGRQVRLEVAADITERKQVEVELQEAQKELKVLAEIDSLTQLYNRRAFFMYADKLRKSLSKSSSLGLMILDLDYFKDINDNYGHEAGDTLLAAIGQKLNSLADSNTVIGRMGGEEFAIVFHETEKREKLDFANQVYKAVSNVKALYFNDLLHCTTSIGVSSQPASTPLRDIMREADNALYKAKSAGRSQVNVA